MGNVKNILVSVLIVSVLYFGFYLYKKPSFSNGAYAPDFVGYLANGDSIRLSDFKGQMVLIDFWGSWCGPCRFANKELVQIYAEFKDAKFKDAEGLTIISVGLERSKKSWLKAIERDGLIWPYHISDLKRMKDHVAELYSVKEIPETYLVNGSGKIIGVNLSKAKMREVLTHFQVK